MAGIFPSQGQLLVVISGLTMYAKNDSDIGLEDLLGMYFYLLIFSGSFTLMFVCDVQVS